MATTQEMLIEANKRGLLTGARKAAFDEALKRGIIKQSSATPITEEGIQPQAEFIEEIGPVRAGIIATGKGFANIGRGAQRLLATLTGDEKTQEQIQKAAEEEERAFAPLRESSPVSTFIGEVAGETAAFPLGGLGRSLATRAATAVGTGATAGGLSEAGRGAMAEDVAGTAILGGALGPVGEAVSALAVGVGGDAIERLRSLVKRKTGEDLPQSFFNPDGSLTQEALSAVDNLNITEEEFKEAFSGLRIPIAEAAPETAFRAARAAQEGVTLTAGQSSRDFAEQSAEDTLRALATEEGAEARGFFNQQQLDLLEARNNFVRAIGGDLDATRAERGLSVKSSLSELKNAATENVSRLYRELAELPGGDQRINLDNLAEFKGQVVREYAPTSRIDRGLNNIFEDFMFAGKIGPNFEGPLTFKNAEKFRKRLNRLNPSEPADIAAVRQVKDAFDNLIAAETQKFPDNTEIGQAAARARKAAAERFADFKAKDIIEELMAFKRGTRTESIPEDLVFDKLFVGSNRKVENIKRVKSILLKNPTDQSRRAWQNVQSQGVLDIFDKATSETPDGFVVSGAKLKSAIERFGRPALKQLLTTDQYKQLMRINNIVGDATIPVPRTTNPSGTALKLMNALNRINLLSSNGLVDKISSLVGVGIGSIREASERQQVLRGIQEGARPLDRANSFLQTVVSSGAQKGLQEAGRRTLSKEEQQ